MKSKLFLLQLLSFSSFAATDYCKDGTGLYVNVCFNDDLSAAVDDLQAEIDSQVSAESQSRADGDASTLSSANTYTDGKVTAESQSRADGDASTLSSANTYTNEVFSSFTADSNKKFESIDHKINKLSDRLNAAIAGSTAIASIPYVAEDSFSFGVGIGNYSNGNAVALGSQYKTSRNSNIRVNVSWDSTGNVASGAGFSAGW
jgi:autotransporter adhesin